jgi:hypothetical protein
MEPMYSVWYYLEAQRQLAASKGSARERLVDIPADQELNLLRAGQAPVDVRASDQAKTKPPEGGNSLIRLNNGDVLLTASEEMDFEWFDPLTIHGTPMHRAKARLVAIALVFLLSLALVTFGLACLLSPTFLS